MSYDPCHTLSLSTRDIIERVKANEHFGLARCGVGEWNAILQHEGSNCDGHPYTESLGKALEEVIRDRDIFVGIHTGPKLKPAINDYLTGHGIKRDWVKNELFQDAWKKGQDHELYYELTRKDVVLVANEQIEFPKYRQKITVPENNCWQYYDEIVMDCEKEAEDDAIFLIAAGMPGAVMVSELRKTFKNCTFIDVGSWLDGWNGIQSRSWIRKNL